MEQTLQIRSYFSPEFQSLEGRVFEQAVHVLGTPERASRWLETSKWRFDGQTPIQMLRTQQGVRKVEEMLGQIDATIFA
jgi:uncharacterized protein (DUF2384 family)